jgi:hypothetical protein
VPYPGSTQATGYLPSTTTPFNSNYPFDSIPTRGTIQHPILNLNPNYEYVYDTWYNQIPGWNNFAAGGFNGNLIPFPARIYALQITIRIYDPKTNQARQNTWRIAM